MKKRILIIDDDEDFSLEVEEILEDEGYQVEIALDGITAKSLINKKKYDLILLDLKLPKIDGFTLLNYIKSKFSDTKVIIISGNPMIMKDISPEISRGRKKNKDIFSVADSLFTKTSDFEDLFKKIEEFLKDKKDS